MKLGGELTGSSYWVIGSFLFLAAEILSKAAAFLA